MSAFIVSHEHIDALLTFAVTHRLRYFVDGRPVDIAEHATETGTVLLLENTRSVLHRYPDCTESTAPGREGETALNYTFQYFDALDTLPQHKLVGLILSGCSCFDYQSCETNDYESSVACQIIEAIRTEAIRMVPKYDAPWEITRDTVKAFGKAR
jgi:hypothetical protein